MDPPENGRMNIVEPASIQCPYCWEQIELTVDCSVEQQQYTEDCQVCCRPIVLDIRIGGDGTPQVEARTEDE
jgi:hypothetical protein